MNELLKLFSSQFKERFSNNLLFSFFIGVLWESKSNILNMYFMKSIYKEKFLNIWAEYSWWDVFLKGLAVYLIYSFLSVMSVFLDSVVLTVKKWIRERHFLIKLENKSDLKVNGKKFFKEMEDDIIALLINNIDDSTGEAKKRARAFVDGPYRKFHESYELLEFNDK